MKISAALLACFLFLSLCACTTPSRKKEEAQLRLSIGSNLLANGRYHEALETLLAAEKDDPQDAVIQNNLALAYLVLERPDLAYTHAVKAVKLAPKFSEARNNLGRIAIELGHYKEAVTELTRVLNDLTYPYPEKALVNMGMAYFAQREYQKALTPLSKAIAKDRENCLAYNFIGRSQYELSQFDKAAETLDRAAKLCERARFDEPRYYSALSYYKLGQKDQALARVDELLSLFPEGKYREKATTMKNLIK